MTTAGDFHRRAEQAVRSAVEASGYERERLLLEGLFWHRVAEEAEASEPPPAEAWSFKPRASVRRSHRRPTPRGH